jgi:CheY-like chemotaxis protein
MTPPRQPQTVLVVDDNPGVLALLAEHLASHGYHVLAASDASAAIALAQQHTPHAAVLDLFLPGPRGGLSVLDALERLTPPPAVVLISGIHDALDLIRAARPGTPTLAKPLNLDALVRALAEQGAPHGAPP